MKRKDRGVTGPREAFGAARRDVLRAGVGSLATAMFGAGRDASAEVRYPDRPVRIIVPWPAGGVSDSGTRRIAAVMEQFLGGRILVENRPGASGQLATEAVARAAPDGYTLLSGDIATHGINPCVYPKMRVDVFKDFQPVSLRTRGGMVLVVHASSPVRTFADLLTVTRSASGPMPYASPGLGTLQHLEMERLIDVTGARLRPVPYKGEAPALTDVAAGQVPVMIAFPLVAVPHIQSGRLRALAVTSRSRLASLPDTPTFAELGRPELESYSWGAFFAPRGTPRPIVDRVAQAVARSAQDARLREFLAPFGAEPVACAPEALAKLIQEEATRLCAIVRRAGIALE